MQIFSKRNKDILIITLEGELDHHHAKGVRQALDRMLEDTSIRYLVLDLSGLCFMDSSGIGVFIGRYKVIKKRDGQTCIAGVNSQLDKILEVSGLYNILKAYDNVEEAINGIRGVA
ncbi:MAG TPA: anti-sigma F factor antagonist [Bacillota bacterium]|nr:anti-sigma F factor antagonist [Bacillota bacterium]